MKLFRVNERSKASELILNLEKIAKISVLRIEKEDFISAIEDLKWLEDNFIDLLKLKDSSFQKFKTIFDEGNRYKKVEFESIQWDKVDFSKVKVVQVHDKLTEEDKRYRKRYVLQKPPDKNDVLSKYIEVIFSIWNKAEEKKQFTLQKQCTYVFANWIGVLDRFDDDRIAFGEIIKYFLTSLTNLNWSLLQIKGDELHPSFRFLSFNIYLEKIFDEELNKSNTDIYFKYLYENVYLSIKAGRPEVVNEFIERCIDSTFSPAFELGAYSELHSLLYERLRTNNLSHEVSTERLKRITEFGFVSLRYLRTREEYLVWQTNFSEYLEGIEDQNLFGREITLKVAQIEEIAYRYLNFNKLQITVIKVLVFSIFKNSKLTIDHAFEFNQPGDSNAIFSNREIIPDSIGEILNYVTFTFTIEGELAMYWEGHHGIATYIRGFFLIVFYRFNPNKNYYTENPAQSTKDFCKDRLSNDSTSIASLKSQIDELTASLKAAQENETAFFTSYFSEPEKVKSTISLLELISSSCQGVLNEIQVTSEIKAKTKNNFLNKCIEQYKKFNYIYRLFKKYTNDDAAPILEPHLINPGINELLDRTAFIENWHVPYYGIIEAYGNGIAEKENNWGLGAIRRLTKLGPVEKITAGDIPKYIRQANVPGIKIVIASNLYFDSILRDEKDYVPVGDSADDEIPGFFIGRLGDAMIFNVYDRVFSQKQMMIISSDYLQKVVEMPLSNADGFTIYDSFMCKFIDFAYDDQARNNFLDSPPQWLSEQIKDRIKQEEFMKTKVWVQIKKGIFFDTAQTKGGKFFEII